MSNKVKLLIVTTLLSIACNGQKTLPKGTIVGYEPNGEPARIGDTAWHYVGSGWDYQFDVLTSTRKYPYGIWLPVGKVYKNKCKCNPKEFKLEGFNNNQLNLPQ